MDDNILQNEREKLADVQERLADAQAFLEERLDAVGEENLERLRDLRDNPETSGLDFAQFLDQLHQENLSFNIKDKYTRLAELDFLSNEPYFARIDLKDADGESNPIYIGKFGYTEDIPIVTDWRAKVASVYYRYRYPQKNVKYDTPDGTETRDLLLKRTFEIDDNHLVKYYNNDLQLDESQIIAEKIEKRTGGVLEDIVETIQEAQLDIIEADPRQVCIVQGSVGSGKSTVAIHKLSHIFFNFPDVVKPERSILIAKNQILVGYLSTLFPKLGIFDINYKTLRELIVNLVFREKLKVTIDLDEDVETAHLDIGFVNKLNKDLEKVHEKYEKFTSTLFDKEEFASFGGFKYSRRNTPLENLVDAIEDLENELVMQKESHEENPKSIKALFYKENIKIIRKIVTKIKKERVDLQNKVLKNLLKTYRINIDQPLGYAHALIYVLIYLELIGLRKFRKYEYCVIDEGQDFSLLEYSVLQKLVLFGRFCILGDLNQSYLEEGLTDWEQISEVVTEAKNAQVFTLETNYRSTKPIIDLANNILSPYTNDYLPKSINRVGEDPEIKGFASKEQMLAEFETNIANEAATLDKSIGVICFDKETYSGAKQILEKQQIEDGRLIELKADQQITYLPKGIYYSMFENCKGLEFSKVYVLDLNLNKISSFTDAKKAFVSVTRAMNELSLYHVE